MSSKENISALKQELINKKIKYNLINDTLILIKLYKQDAHKLHLAIHNFMQKINAKLINPQQSAALIADIRPVSYFESTNTESHPIIIDHISSNTPKVKRNNISLADIKIEEKNPTSEEEKTTITPANMYSFFKDKLPQNLTIKNETTYRLYGTFGTRQNICIDEKFIASIEDKKTRKKLYSLCERGKILGNSKGQKGFIINGEQIKGKDASKDYRFKGHVVAKHIDDRQKEHTLFIIDEIKWKHKTHGQ